MNMLSMYVVDLSLVNLVSCIRMMLGLLCMVCMRSIMHGRLELIWHVFHVMMWMLVLCVFVYYG